MENNLMLELFKANPYTVGNGGFEQGLKDWMDKNAITQKIIQFKPAFDKRDPDPSKNYGIHCMDIYMVLKGEKGAISFCIYTGWYLPQNQENSARPRGACICYHSPKAKYEDQQISQEECEYLDNKPCYCDCSYIAADELFEQFVAQGEEVVWSELQDRYDHL